MQSCRHETRVMGHVDHQQRAHVRRDLAEPSVRNLPRVGTRTGHDELRTMLLGQTCNLIEVDAVMVLRDAIAHELIQLAGDVEPHAVGEVSSVSQV